MTPDQESVCVGVNRAVCRWRIQRKQVWTLSPLAEFRWNKFMRPGVWEGHFTVWLMGFRTFGLTVWWAEAVCWKTWRNTGRKKSHKFRLDQAQRIREDFFPLYSCCDAAILMSSCLRWYQWHSERQWWSFLFYSLHRVIVWLLPSTRLILTSWSLIDRQWPSMNFGW